MTLKLDSNVVMRLERICTYIYAKPLCLISSVSVGIALSSPTRHSGAGYDVSNVCAITRCWASRCALHEPQYTRYSPTLIARAIWQNMA